MTSLYIFEIQLLHFKGYTSTTTNILFADFFFSSNFKFTLKHVLISLLREFMSNITSFLLLLLAKKSIICN